MVFKKLVSTALGMAVLALIDAWRSPAEQPVLPAASLGADEDLDQAAISGWRALMPVWCLLALTALLVGSLSATGYLSVSENQDLVDKLERAIDPTTDENVALRRAAMAYSGIMLALTFGMTLCIAGIVRARKRKCAIIYRRSVMLPWLALVVVAIGSLVALTAGGRPSFASQIGMTLIESARNVMGIGAAQTVAEIMFLLGCVAPAVLALGMCLLLQPMRQPVDAAHARLQIVPLAARRRELDQLLYAGAIALVFGTLQLGAALAVPLAGMPGTADVKRTIDVCKALHEGAPSAASGTAWNLQACPASIPASTATPAHRSSYTAQIAPKFPGKCACLATDANQANVADSLRELKRGLTLTFGLAFSALLVAIHVPTLLGLRKMLNRAVEQLEASPEVADQALAKESDLTSYEPLARIAALFAMISPLLASLVSNALSGV